MKSEKRKRKKFIGVRLTHEEYDKISSIAEATVQSRSSYLRNIGMRYQPQGRIDQEAIKDLIKINSDLGRLGGLLKHLFFSKNDSKRENLSAFKSEVNNILDEIKNTKDKLQEKILIL